MAYDFNRDLHAVEPARPFQSLHIFASDAYFDLGLPSTQLTVVCLKTEKGSTAIEEARVLRNNPSTSAALDANRPYQSVSDRQRLGDSNAHGPIVEFYCGIAFCGPTALRSTISAGGDDARWTARIARRVFGGAHPSRGIEAPCETRESARFGYLD